jgi:hypothetical protein
MEINCSYFNPVFSASGTDEGFASSTCESSTTASTSPAYYYGFSYGELVGTTLLFLILTILIYQFTWKK